jgi:hypothetical protein
VVRNIGGLDRLVRFYLGLVLIAFALPYWAPQTGWNALGWLGLVPVLTAIAGHCPIYRLAGTSSLRGSAATA